MEGGRRSIVKKVFRTMLALVAVLGLSLAAVPASRAGEDETKTKRTEEAIKADAEKAEKAVEKKVEKKVDEVTYKKGEKPGDMYKNTESPPAESPASPPAQE
jgi:hypothetical protein